MSLRALVEPISELLMLFIDWFKAFLRKKEQSNAQADVDDVEHDPATAFDKHFSMHLQDADDADEADAERN